MSSSKGKFRVGVDIGGTCDDAFSVRTEQSYCGADASASPILSPTLEADALTVSWARCAYRAVVCTCVWPRSLPIMGRLSPSATAREAKECLRSWMRTPSRPARVRMRRQGCCRSVRCEPGFFPEITHGFSESRGRAERTRTAASASGTIREPVFVSLRRKHTLKHCKYGDIYFYVITPHADGFNSATLHVPVGRKPSGEPWRGRRYQRLRVRRQSRRRGRSQTSLRGFS